MLNEMGRLLRLAAPILVAQLSQTLMGFVDTVMAGQVSATDMASVAVGASLWWPMALFVLGICMALTPMVANHHGAKDDAAIAPIVQQGAWLALGITVLIMALAPLSPWVLDKMAVEPALARKTELYIYFICAGLPAFALYNSLRNFVEGMSHTIPTMIIGFAGLLVNIPANYIFIHGLFGMPELGGAGCGLATALVMWFMFFAALIYSLFTRRFAHIGLYKRLYWPQWQQIVHLAKIGIPIAMSIFFEVSLFALVALLISPLGSVVVAGHQIAINFSSLVFMFPMSLAMAVTIRVGHRMGEGHPAQARTVAYAGFALGQLVAISTCVLTVLFSKHIITLYSDDGAVLALAGQLILLAAIYQLPDACQVVAGGALRGYKDSHALFLITMLAYWGIGLPLGYTLGLTDLIRPAMGPHGFWIGFIAGLSSAAVMMVWRLRVLHRRSAQAQIPLEVIA
ncbi:MATE family efflux transporter [Gallaecimonas kandeliae]|uniref:MATE family efflux transporter n=1 Tax=Gallaecimonas kandeliae TaxID=3029055 RepID=UPI0026494639|nr:MATE family efflux transporter [Gallaecimonas kandeliae]WKE64062.1 MATE family efflux transporter [Gallaecimonas kandeliae]